MNAAKKNTGTYPATRKEIANTAAGKKAQLEAKQYQRMRQSYFSNLLLLGFDKEANEKKDNVIYNEDTFVVANNKGALTVLHFLLDKLDPDECKSRFRGIWPVFDKKQEQSFRKETCGWLNKVALEDPEAGFSRLNPSLFLSPGGYRFQLFLYQLSKYVLLKSLRRDCGVAKESYLRCPVLKTQTPQLTDVQVKILKNTTVKLMRSFVTNVQQSLQVHSKWHEQSGDMVKNYRMLCKKVRALERKDKQNADEKESAEKWAGDKQVKDESLKTVREDWLKFKKTLESQDEECEIIKSILENLASHYKIDMGTINARIPDLLLRVQEHQIQERQIDNLYKEGKLNLVSLVQLLNLSLEMYFEKLKSAGLPNAKENIAPMQQKSETHSNLLQNMQTLRENMKEQLHMLKSSVQASAEIAEKKAVDQKLLPMEFTLNAPTPPRNFQLLCDRSVAVDSPLFERRLPAESIDTPEAAKRIQLAAKENALKLKDLKKTQNESILDQLSLVEEKQDDKKSKLPVKVAESLSRNKESFDSTPQIKNNKSLDKASFRMQIRNLGMKAGAKNSKAATRSKSLSDFSEKKGVNIWADQIIDHVMGVTDVDPQSITEALSMDAFKSRDKLARSPVKSSSSSNSLKKFSPSQEIIPEIEIDAGTPSPFPCRKNVSLKSVSGLTDISSSPLAALDGTQDDDPPSASPTFADQRHFNQSELYNSPAITTPAIGKDTGRSMSPVIVDRRESNQSELNISPAISFADSRDTRLSVSPASADSKDTRLSVSPALVDRRQSNQSEKSFDISLDAYLQLPSNHSGLNLDIFDDVPCPKMHFSGLNSGEDASDRSVNLPPTPSIESILKDRSSKKSSGQQDIDCSDYFTPLKQGLHLTRTSNSLLEDKPANINQSNLLNSVLLDSMAAYGNSLTETEELKFEDEEPVFLVP